MSERMTIRAAKDSEREQMLAVWLASVRATHTFLSEQDVQKLLPLVRDQALPALELWVLVENGVIIGFSGLADNKLEALFLHPDHFGKGGGRMLVDHARRLKGPLLVDVNEQNVDAVRFYEALGFEVFGRSETDDGGRPFPLLHMRDLIAVPRNEPVLLAGADGSNDGWVVATRYSDAGGVCCFVVNSIAELFQRQAVPDLVAIDVPVGLPESGPRQCDLAARRLLGRFRGTSVFAAPVRAMLPTRSYEDACRTGRAVDGRALSRQCWSILPKIREVDDLVARDSEVRSRVREVHPEVSFWAMAGTPILEPKRSKKGQAQRLDLLEKVYGGVVDHAITGCRKDGAKAHDVLDAFVALWSAARIHNGSALAIPDQCETDPCGIKMQIFA